MSEPTCVFPGLDWESADPAVPGVNPQALAGAALALSRPQSNARAWLVVQYGKIATEQYFHGSHPQDRHPLFSITKSVLGLLLGMVLSDRLEQPVIDFFPEITFQPGNPIRLLTFRHLLTMTCGLAWPSAGWGSEPMVERMRRSPNWAEFILSVPVRRSEIGTFHYNSAASHLLAIILQRANAQNVCQFAQERLFTPLGISPVVEGRDWESDPAGNSIGGWGLHLSARELARIGWLALCGGQWQEQTRVPRQWLDDSTHLPEDAQAGYGYHWWLRKVHDQAVFAGIGIGGQYLFCVPNRQMVVVILSQRTHHWPDRWEVLKMLLS